MTVNILPDNVLLEIFDYYLAEAYGYFKYEKWLVPVHVCQKWRYVVFQSPLRLNLRIICSERTLVREKLAVWPQLPIIIEQYNPFTEDSIIAALGHEDRICKIDLTILGSLLEMVFTAMQKIFVALNTLWLDAIDDMDDRAPVISDSFLGGSAPHLRHLSLINIPSPFPVLQKLLLSAPDLVILQLGDIPHSGYISPEAMVTCLSALTRLNALSIGFKSPRSRPPGEGRHPPPTRTVLPALTELAFTGVTEYLEDLVTRIDAPLLDSLELKLFHLLIFDTPQLVQLISRTPKLKAYDTVRVTFGDSYANISLAERYKSRLELGTSCRQSDWQLSSLAQLCTSFFLRAPIPTVEHLYIDDYVVPGRLWQGDLENNQWLELFHPFTTVKNLYLSRVFLPRIAPALQELVGERVTEVLPNLQRIFLEDPQQSGSILQFIAARQLSSRPIAIYPWSGKNRWSTIYYIDDL